MTASAHTPRRPTWAILWSILCWAAAAPGARGAPEDEAIADAVVEVHHANRERLRDFVLAWSLTASVEDQAWGLVGTRVSTFEMWRKGEKLATRSSVQGWVDNPDGTRTLNDHVKSRGGWDGTVSWHMADEERPTSVGIESRPQFMPNENHLSTIGWMEPTFLERARGEWSDKYALASAQVEDRAAGRICVVELTATNGNGRFVVSYGLDRGGCLLEEDWFTKGGVRTRHTVMTPHEVDEGLWFPVKLATHMFSPDDGHALFSNVYELDLPRCAFNDEATPRIDDELFRVPITADMDVLDHRAGKMLVYDGRTAPLPPDELKQRVEAIQSAEAASAPWRPGVMFWSTTIVVGAVSLAAAGYLFVRRRA